MKKHLWLLVLLIIPFVDPSAESSKDFHLSAATITPHVLKYIKDSYIDQSRIKPHDMLKSALNQVQKSTAEILVTFEQNNKFTITIDQAVKKFSPQSLSNLGDLWAVLKDVYTFIEVHYHGTVEPQDVEYLAIDGLLNVLDPHSNILTPKIFDEFKIGTKGKFGGIGIVIGSKDGNLAVISPIEGTPAWRAGVKAGDKIIQIGEESTVNMTLTEAVELLRGNVGTNVTITIDRAGRPAPFNVTLKRAVINIESIQSVAIPVENKTVGYIKVKSFQEETVKEFSRQLANLKGSPNFKGLIMDLRNDPGGLLNQAVLMVDKFISGGVIVSTIGADNTFIDQEMATGQGTEVDYPLIVIVNEGSASASEIVAGTLQSYKRALVIGSQSFGKGSVQTVYDLGHATGLKLTIAEYLTAGKNSIQSVGVTPDIKLIPEIVDKDKMDLIENEYDNEGTLEAHLNQYVNASAGSSAYKLSHFQPAEKENEDEVSRREYSSKLDFSKDIAVQIASKIITASSNGSYADLLKSTQAVIANREKDENAKIANALSKFDVDWSDCNGSGKPVLQVVFTLAKNGSAVKHAVAGQDIDLTMTAKNVGTGDFCKLVGITSSKEHILKNKEFVFGKIPAGSTKKWSIPLKVPQNSVSENLPFTVKFHETGHNQPAEFQAVVPTVGLGKPQFAYNFKIGVSASVKVHKNSMPIGKTIPFSVDVKNTGKGNASDVVAIIKNPESSKGVFIDVGRVKLGKMDATQTKQALFKFRLDPAMPKSAFELELTIIDMDSFTSLTKKIEFNSSAGTTDPVGGQWYEPPRININSEHFPIVTNASKYQISGTITDEQQVKDYFIFVGEDKVAYSSNPLQTGEYNISAELPLKNGNNKISVIARDNQDMSSRYGFVIEKK